MVKNLNEDSLLLLISKFLLNISSGKTKILKDLKQIKYTSI